MCKSCIYQRIYKGERQIIAIYVDDLLLVTKTLSDMTEFKGAIAARFKSTDQGPVRFLLGLKIERNRQEQKMWISQEANVDEVIKRFNLSHAKTTPTPVASGTKLKSMNGKELSAEMKSKPFRQVVGTLMYLMIGSRPDLAFAITNVSTYMSNYDREHWEAVKRVLRYVKGTKSHRLEYGGDSVKLSAYTDSDYAGDVAERKSTSGYVTFVGNCAVTWSSRKQRIIATSTAEAEYIALAHCAREVLFLRQFLKELGHPQQATVIREDNQACIKIAENPAHHARTKHIDVRYHFIRERIELEQITLEYVESKENIADIFTKGLERDIYHRHRDRLPVFDQSDGSIS
jgi:Reverse transcriptase (RNA-dependent DNA polymerase)